MSRVYLDHNATTPLRPEARAAYLEALEGTTNASSLHASGRRARARVDEARERVAAALGVAEDEVLFTSGGTESNNLALLGAMAGQPEGHIVTTGVEHPSVLEAAAEAQRRGARWVSLAVDGQGTLDEGAYTEALRDPRCRVVSVMRANNEIGTVYPLPEIAQVLRNLSTDHRPVFHTDAVQALGRIPIALDEWGVDLATFSAHKVGGPVGCGVLVRRSGVELANLMFGGGQESELRPGTENVAAIAASAVAIELAVAEQEAYAHRVGALARALWSELHTTLPEARLLGPSIDAAERLPNTVTVSIGDLDGRVLVTRLDVAGLEASAGSACASGSLEPSHVLLALGLSRERARAGLRLSLGRTTTNDDVVRAVEILRGIFATRP